MEAVFTRQSELITEIKRIKTNFDKDSSRRKSSEYIKVRVTALDQLWGEFEQNDKILSDYPDKNHEYFTNATFGKIREFYDTLRQTLLDFADSSTSKEVPAEPMPFPRGEKKSMFDIPDIDKGLNALSSRDQAEELLSQQRTYFRAFNRVCTRINIDSIDEKWEIEDQLKDLQRRWRTIDELHMRIDNILQDPVNMNDNGSFEANSQPIYDLISLDSNGDMQFDYSYSHYSIEQDTSYSSSATGSTGIEPKDIKMDITGIETKDVKMDFTKTDITVPLLQNSEFFEDKVLKIKYLDKLDSLLRPSEYRITPIRKKSSAIKTALLKTESEIDVPKKQMHLKDNEEVPCKPKRRRHGSKERSCTPKRTRHESNERPCNPKYGPESKVNLSLPSQTRKPSHLLSEYGQLGRHYKACDPNCNDRLEAQSAIIRCKEQEKEEAIERQKDNYSKRGVFGEFSNNVMAED